MKRFLVGTMLGISLIAFGEPVEPPKSARCVVCTMDVNMMPNLTSQAKLKDGKRVFAESPKHIIEFFLKNRDRVKEIWVRDFKSGKWINGMRAYYVPIEEGPMGMDLAAFKSKSRAKKFAKGGKVYSFKDIDEELIKHLNMGHKDKHGGHMKH
jgi:nitrous oxide reductase accessory protein NosL